MWLGLLGVLAFSFTLPATRVAVEDLDATFVGLGRAVVAAMLAAAWLAVRRDPWPTRSQWRSLAVVVGGVVLGFPLLTALALRDLPSAHSAVIVGVLPAATAVAAVLRTGERPSGAFWLASGAGLTAALVFAAAQGAGTPQPADLLLLGAVAAAAMGYAEGAMLTREIGGRQTISWALIAGLPVTLPAAVAGALAGGLHAPADAWLGFAYVSAVSAFLGFLAWYAGLAAGGVAKIGQVQLVQPLLTLMWSALLLGEHVSAGAVAAAVAIVLCVALTQRTVVGTRPASGRERVLASGR